MFHSSQTHSTFIRASVCLSNLCAADIKNGTHLQRNQNLEILINV